MWSLSTNNILGGILAAVILIFAADNLGDFVIPPYEPVQEDKSVVESKSAPAKSDEKKAEVPVQSLGALLASASADRGKKVAKKCASCHTFNKGGKNKIGPNLYAILGRDRGSADGYSYSGAMKKIGGKWGFDDLNKFILKPKQFLPKTKMTFAGIKKAGDRAALILYMRSFADAPAALPK